MYGAHVIDQLIIRLCFSRWTFGHFCWTGEILAELPFFGASENGLRVPGL